MSNPIDIQAIRPKLVRGISPREANALCDAIEAANARIAEMEAEHEPMPSVRLTLHPAVLATLRAASGCWNGGTTRERIVAQTYSSLPTEIKKLVEGE